MNTKLISLPAIAAILALAGGCVAAGPYAPADTAKFTLENTDRFVLLDQPM